MWIIKPSRIRQFATEYPAAAPSLIRWLKLARTGEWHSLVDVRKAIPSADEVRVASRRTVVVFNIKGNDFRLITAVHYNRGKVFVLSLLTHAEYSRNSWKDVL